MKVKLIRAGIIALVVLEALVAMMMTREVLVLLTIGLMLFVGLLSRDSKDWGFYTFTATTPLVITIGEWNLAAGGIILVTSFGFLFQGSWQHGNWKEYAATILLMLVIVQGVIVSSAILGVTGLAVVLVFIGVTGSALALFRNRLLKQYYRGNME
jgi:hypothetical protein